MKKSMNLLIVEGNIKETRVEREKFGILPFYKLFPEMLRKMNPKVQTVSVFPADDDKHLPSITQLKNYDGVLWTGSALHILDNNPAVTRQLNFADDVFKSGVPFYGSCWGMQVATVAAGGKVKKNPLGLEVGITTPISMTKEGKQSPFYKHRKNNFEALCIHLDEVIQLPENAIVLAFNKHSKVQSMTLKYKKSTFFGVQYHPEFRTKDLGLIMSYLAEDIVNTGLYTTVKEVEQIVNNLVNQKDLPIDVTDYNIHTQEIRAWLDLIK